MSFQPIINGFTPSWSTSMIELDGDINVALKAISYKHGIAKKAQYGLGKGRYAVAVGQYTAECSVEMFGPGAKQFRDRLISKAASVVKQSLVPGSSGPSYADVRFNIRVSYINPQGTLVTDKILSCEIVDEEATLAQGEDGNGFKYTLLPNVILMDGKPLTEGLIY